MLMIFNRGTVKHYAFNVALGERTSQQEVFHQCGVPVIFPAIILNSPSNNRDC